MMVKEKRFLPVESHEPVEEDFDDFESDFYDDKKHLPRRKSLYVAS
ncbi:hypothetical protein HYV82_01475 [Candidatus Woesearchaeota archaeon]|nr:hypothetical protein [Candidatus Woesearchaeota archaeon]